MALQVTTHNRLFLRKAGHTSLTLKGQIYCSQRSVREYYYRYCTSHRKSHWQEAKKARVGVLHCAGLERLLSHVTFRKVSALWDRWNSENRFCSHFVDIDSRQHQFDPSGTNLPVERRGTDSALGWMTPSVTATPIYGLMACAVAILLFLKQCLWRLTAAIIQAMDDCMHRVDGSPPLSCSSHAVFLPQPFNASHLSWG